MRLEYVYDEENFKKQIIDSGTRIYLVLQYNRDKNETTMYVNDGHEIKSPFYEVIYYKVIKGKMYCMIEDDLEENVYPIPEKINRMVSDVLRLFQFKLEDCSDFTFSYKSAIELKMKEVMGIDEK